MSFSINLQGQQVIQASIDGVGQSIDITSPNSGTSVIIVEGTWDASFKVQGANGNSNYVDIISYEINDKIFQTTIDENGTYKSNTNGFEFLRITTDSYTSGTANFFIHGSDATSIITTQSNILGKSGHVAEIDSLGNQKVKFGESNQLDMWGRIRTSLPFTLFELNFTFSEQPLNMYTITETGGTSTYNYNTSGMDMQVNTTSGSRVVRQTRRYFRYITGKGIRILTTTTCESAKEGLVQEWGFFDDIDGMFIRYDNTSLKAVIRSSTSGTSSDIEIPQSSWNLDKLDGTGPSGTILDPTKYIVWVIDFAWQGTGGVRFGIYHNANVVYFHQYKPSNTLETAFTRTAVLPIRYEMRNVATTSSASTMYHGTLGVVIDASSNLSESAIQFSSSREASSKSIGTTLAPLMSIRPKLTFNSNINRVPINSTNIDVTSETQILYYQILKNATLTGASFNSSSDNSAVEFDIAATSYTGGQKISEGYVLANSQGNRINIQKSDANLDKLNFIGLNIQGTVAENIVIVARTLTSTSSCLASMFWEEFQ